ncbi:ABC transporter substrate-binding protein [Aureivirga sp. CE67]|uniref:ABC transporter substrate-binding protein n=1 Tax=Aureivirga sp. CE67 TaxID=1788983 RepID=UPI0018CA102E|nr:ABC transporter substrate-binding protein [Aureivirga sp. CE67]
MLKKIIPFFLIAIFSALILISCESKKEEKKEVQKEIKIAPSNIKYAEGFQLESIENVQKLTISSPKSEKKETFVLAKKGVEIPENLKSYTKIEVPIQKIIVTSTTHVPMLEAINKERTLVGFPNTFYVSSKRTRALINAGNVKEVGNQAELNSEKVLDLSPDILVGFMVDNEPKSYTTIRRAGIPILLNGDWLEASPLGKAEWIKFFGALYGENDFANKVFNNIETEYLKVKELAKTAKNVPTLLSGHMYKDIWNLPAGESYAAVFFKDANTNYLWKDSKGTGSLSLNFESVLDKAKNADFWVGAGSYTSYDELAEANKHYTEFNAFKNKKVYSFGAKKGETGGLLYYEYGMLRPDLILKDIVKITHPELLENYQNTFFEPLK